MEESNILIGCDGPFGHDFRQQLERKGQIKVFTEDFSELNQNDQSELVRWNPLSSLSTISAFKFALSDLKKKQTFFIISESLDGCEKGDLAQLSYSELEVFLEKSVKPISFLIKELVSSSKNRHFDVVFILKREERLKENLFDKDRINHFLYCAEYLAKNHTKDNLKVRGFDSGGKESFEYIQYIFSELEKPVPKNFRWSCPENSGLFKGIFSK